MLGQTTQGVHWPVIMPSSSSSSASPSKKTKASSASLSSASASAADDDQMDVAYDTHASASAQPESTLAVLQGSCTERLIHKFLVSTPYHLGRMRAAGKALAKLTDCPMRNGKKWYEEGY